MGLEFEVPYLLMSALQKNIRSGKTTEAMLNAADLLRQAPDILWSRLKIIAHEDSAQSIEYATTFALWLEYQKELKKPKEQQNTGLQLIRAMTAAKLLAESKKDRRADEIFHLIRAAEDGSISAEDILTELRKNAGILIPDVAHDMHAGRDSKGRGYLHFVEGGSKCKNMTEEYESWRSRWEAIMKDWALKHPRWKP
jgi:hypothetical protein